MSTYKVIILGSGGIGRAAGLILAVNKTMDIELFFTDINQHAINSAIQFVKDGTENSNTNGILLPKDGITEEFQRTLQNGDIILDCLPGIYSPAYAKLAVENNLHYINLTEHVQATNEITKIAKNSETGFVLQTGVAPGFVNILAHKLYQDFQEKYGTDELELMEMKVGALSENASAPHFYNFTWSPVGVATEYVKKAVVVKNHQVEEIDSLTDTQELVIGGIRYEDDYTSGGAADFPTAFQSKIANINYKTLRFPGHFGWVRNELKKLDKSSNVVSDFEKVMLDCIPAVENDRIIIYTRVKGKDQHGILRALDKVVHVKPTKIGNQTLRAIQATTAAPMCECARMLLQGELKPGINLQSELNPTDFLKSPYIQMVYGNLSEL